MYHKITLIGYLGSDPERRLVQGGNLTVTNFSMAVKYSKDKTMWVRVSVFGKQADACFEYLHKGSLVHVDGELSPDKDTSEPRVWITQDGKPRASWEVRANNVTFLGKSGSSNDEQKEIPF